MKRRLPPEVDASTVACHAPSEQLSAAGITADDQVTATVTHLHASPDRATFRRRWTAACSHARGAWLDLYGAPGRLRGDEAFQLAVARPRSRKRP